MSSKFGIVAQVLCVAALAAIVYLAFLSPGGSDPLGPIDVEDGFGGDAPAQQSTNPARGAGRPRGQGPAAASNATPGPVVAPRVASGVPPAWQTALDPGRVDTPPGRQYFDSVTRILSEVARADP